MIEEQRRKNDIEQRQQVSNPYDEIKSDIRYTNIKPDVQYNKKSNKDQYFRDTNIRQDKQPRLAPQGQFDYKGYNLQEERRKYGGPSESELYDKQALGLNLSSVEPRKLDKQVELDFEVRRKIN